MCTFKCIHLLLSLLSTVVWGQLRHSVPALPPCLQDPPTYTVCLSAGEWAGNPEVLPWIKTCNCLLWHCMSLTYESQVQQMQDNSYSFADQEGLQIAQGPMASKGWAGIRTKVSWPPDIGHSPNVLPQRLISYLLLITATLPKAADTYIALTMCQAHVKKHFTYINLYYS